MRHRDPLTPAGIGTDVLLLCIAATAFVVGLMI